MVDRKNKTFDYNGYGTHPVAGQIAVAGWTKGVLIVASGSATAGSNAQAVTALTVFITTNYMLKNLPTHVLAPYPTAAII